MQLHTYQQKAVNFILNKKKCCLFLDMGLGKTAITLHAMDKLIAENEVNRVLLIAPLRVCNMVWQQELALWNNLKNIKVSIVTGSTKARINALNNKDSNVFILNRENIVWFYEKYPKAKFDMLVIDEASSFKSSKSKRFRIIKDKLFKYIVLLTGSPCSNGLLDIWGLIYIVDKGKALGRFIGDFKHNYFTTLKKEPYKFILKPNSLKKVSKRINPFCLAMKSEDYLQLPAFIKQNITLQLNESLTKKYKLLDTEFVLYKENTEELLLLIGNKLPLSNKLLQFCNGFVYNDNKESIILHDMKIKAVLDILEDNPNNSYIIAYTYKEDLKVLLKNIKDSKVLSKTGVEAIQWLNKEFRVLLLHPQSSGFGLNLQAGGNNIIWYSLTWSAQDYMQLNKRLHRQGQTKPVIVTHIVIKDCLDERITDVLTNKLKLENQVINSLKDK